MHQPFRISFSRIYSLGMDCQTGHQIARHFGKKSSGPFDWWITHNYSCLKYLQEPSWNTMYDRNHLTIKRGRIVNEYYGVELFHEFRDHVHDQIDPQWKEKFEDHRTRTRYLTQSMLAPGGSILFIRQTDNRDEAFEAELRTILEKNYLYTPWRLLVVEPPIAEDWKGDSKYWTEALKEFSLESNGMAPSSVEDRDTGPTRSNQI